MDVKCVFSVHLTVLWRALAVDFPSVCLSVCPSVKRVLCDKIIVSRYISALLYLELNFVVPFFICSIFSTERYMM